MDGHHSHLHTRVGELTISPMSFSAIIGIAFGGTSILFDISCCNLPEDARSRYVRDLLGFVLIWKNRKNVLIFFLFQGFKRLPTTTPRQIIQKARCFLLILLGTTILYETGHEVSIALLGPLQDLTRVTTFD